MDSVDRKNSHTEALRTFEIDRFSDVLRRVQRKEDQEEKPHSKQSAPSSTRVDEAESLNIDTIQLIIAPPMSGKTTLVKHLVAENVQVIDTDRLWDATSNFALRGQNLTVWQLRENCPDVIPFIENAIRLLLQTENFFETKIVTNLHFIPSWIDKSRVVCFWRNSKWLETKFIEDHRAAHPELSEADFTRWVAMQKADGLDSWGRGYKVEGVPYIELPENKYLSEFFGFSAQIDDARRDRDLYEDQQHAIQELLALAPDALRETKRGGVSNGS